jgi:sodium/proline symporter
MGIQKISDMTKAKYLGMSWQTIALASATLIGLIGIYAFPTGAHDPEHIILDLVKATLPTFFSGLILCAILAATTNVMAAQILVVASNLSEDFYKRLIHRKAGPIELLWVSRSSVILVALCAFFIAFFKISSIYQLVFYAWSGLGSAFGPLILLSLYRKNLNRQGAFAGILMGGMSAAVWYYLNNLYQFGIEPLIVGFICSYLAIELVSWIYRKKSPTPQLW